MKVPIVFLFLASLVMVQEATTNKTYYLGDEELGFQGKNTGTFFEAKASCLVDHFRVKTNARIARIINKEEQTQMEDFLKSKASPNTGYWIGGNFIFIANKWAWPTTLLDYESMDYTNWAGDVREDYSGDIEQMFATYITQDGKWHKGRLMEVRPFICEKPA